MLLFSFLLINSWCVNVNVSSSSSVLFVVYPGVYWVDSCKCEWNIIQFPLFLFGFWLICVNVYLQVSCVFLLISNSSSYVCNWCVVLRLPSFPFSSSLLSFIHSLSFPLLRHTDKWPTINHNFLFNSLISTCFSLFFFFLFVFLFCLSVLTNRTNFTLCPRMMSVEWS